MKIKKRFALCNILLVFASCQKKEYICECQGGLSGGGATFAIEKATKTKAKAECYNYNSGSNIADGFHHCKLK